jgi:hypothetical protein
VPPDQGRSFVTIAQLVHPALGLARLPGQLHFRIPHRAGDRPRSSNATLWRGIGVGLGFALIGLMMVVAIGAIDAAAVVAAPPEGVSVASHPIQPEGLPVGTHPVPARSLETFQDPAEAFGWAMPAP